MLVIRLSRTGRSRQAAYRLVVAENRLREIEKIKDINGEFWKNTELQLNKGLGVITQASSELRENLDEISDEFKEQLNQTLTSLDHLIQRIITKYTKD